MLRPPREKRQSKDAVPRRKRHGGAGIAFQEAPRIHWRGQQSQKPHIGVSTKISTVLATAEPRKRRRVLRKRACAYDFRGRCIVFGNALGNSIVGALKATEVKGGKTAPSETVDPAVERRKQVGVALSEGVYDPEFKGALGFEAVGTDTLAEKGIDQKLLQDDESGYAAKVFQNKETGEYAVAFRGTEPTSGADWWADIKQAFGFETEQYTSAMTLAQQLNKALGPDADVMYTGHSLGGGLASAASAVTGKSAVTFNAAGLNSKTVERFLGGVPSATPSNIQAYYVMGDVVSLLQDFTPLPNASGQRIPLMPTLPGLLMTPIGLHLMDQVKASIRQTSGLDR